MISVLLATYNGAPTIGGTLASLRAAIGRRRDVEVMVVDNASTDGTRRIVEAARAGMPVTLVSETRRGKNNALNTGVAHCRGELIAFTDDDVLVSPLWIEVLAKRAAAHPRLSVFGGPIRPRFSDPAAAADMVRPLSRELMAALYSRRLPIGPVEVAPEHLFGPNFAVRRHVLETVGFDAAVGPDGTAIYRMGSETLFLRMCARAGFRAGFFNRMAVAHVVPAHHLRWAWIYARARRYGYGIAYGDAVYGFDRPSPHIFEMAPARLRPMIKSGDGFPDALKHPPPARGPQEERWWIAARLSYYREYRRLRQGSAARA